MIVKSAKEFQDALLNHLTFKPYINNNCILYHNPDQKSLGHYIKYSRDKYYELGIADYTIPKNFSLTFDNQELLMRFGILYAGKTKFRLHDKPISSFTPSSFFVVEDHIKGQQVWKEGWHYHGVEIILYEKFFTDILYPVYPNCITHKDFLENHTYNYLPVQIISIIQQLNNLSFHDKLTPIYLESKILECIAILTEESSKSPKNSFTNQLYYGDVNIGTNRVLSLTVADINGIQKAHEILTKEFINPPTIANLSKQVLLNEQKLKAGFSSYYHMSIGEYTSTLRMSYAANLLSTTNLSIEEISNKVGYEYSGNFAKMFKKTYGKTPLQFRKQKKIP